ncbi:MAG TPA: VOC family protein [Thermomicrobiales bacterium]|jgi:catechol 2,3-dioxygenase-like lactoylglutathione lyase family enzyme
MQVTGTHHIALFTSDLARLRAFYVETLGLPQVGAFPGGKIIFIDAGSTTIEMIARDGWTDSDAGNWQHLAFEVASVDEAHAELTAKGIVFHIAPKDVPSDENPLCRVAFFRDPDGNNLELFQPIGSRYPQGDA